MSVSLKSVPIHYRVWSFGMSANTACREEDSFSDAFILYVGRKCLPETGASSLGQCI